MCVTNIKNVKLPCFKVKNGQSNRILYLKIEADYINLEVGKIYLGIITHVT